MCLFLIFPINEKQIFSGVHRNCGIVDELEVQMNQTFQHPPSPLSAFKKLKLFILNTFDKPRLFFNFKIFWKMDVFLA